MEEKIGRKFQNIEEVTYLKWPKYARLNQILTWRWRVSKEPYFLSEMYLLISLLEYCL
jgi:hypothetical protein